MGASANLRTAAMQISHLSLGAAAAELMQLNLHYLQLPTTVTALPETIGRAIDALDDAARVAIAGCLYSLFTLGFNDKERWLLLLATGQGGTTALGPVALGKVVLGVRDGGPLDAEFAATAVFFAWHLARSDDLAAQVFLTMDGDVTAALRAVPLARLREVAATASQWLRPRWPENRHFWPALVRHACDPAGAGLRATKLLGHQLLAAESLDLMPPMATQDAHYPRTSRRKRRALRASVAAAQQVATSV
jgi:hypothetical protein